MCVSIMSYKIKGGSFNIIKAAAAKLIHSFE